MKISIVSPVTQLKTNKLNQNKNIKTLPLMVDSVSFSARKNIVEINLEALDTSINEKLIPFINDSKDLYTNLGKVGIKLQKILDVHKAKEADFAQKKFETIVDLPQFIGTIANEINTYKEYKSNINQYNRYVQQSDNEIYKDFGLKEVLNEDSYLFVDDKKFSNHATLHKKIQSISDKYSKKMSDVSLQSSNPCLYSVIELLKTEYTKLAMFMLMTPCNDALHVIKEFKNIKSELKNPKASQVDLLKKTEYLLNQVESIFSRTNSFYENKFTMLDLNAKSYLLISMIPEKSRLDSAYHKMNQNLIRIINEASKEYNKIPERKLIYSESRNLYNIVIAQKNSLETISDIIADAKSAYYAQQNKIFTDCKN